MAAQFIAVMMLCFQRCPGVLANALGAIDVRTWPRSIWIALNCIILFVLLSVRFGPVILNNWKNRRVPRKKLRDDLEGGRKPREQKGSLARIEEARRRID
jgi:hypothetical protein